MPTMMTSIQVPPDVEADPGQVHDQSCPALLVLSLLERGHRRVIVPLEASQRLNAVDRKLIAYIEHIQDTGATEETGVLLCLEHV